ncbi:MAG: sigma-70 family RNA polymerase sigma factor [Bacteroidales bacterium]|nr:sigma-70 family RNA polymerase sigma factor [Bacteroidales bacterium]
MAKESFRDKELLDLIALGDQDAFSTLYKSYWLEMYDNAYKRLKNKKQAEDIVQEVFLSIWQNRTKQKIDNLPAYLHTAVKYKIFNYVERNRFHQTFFDPFNEISLSFKGTDHTLIEKDLHNLLLAYINTLNDKKRELFRLHYIENLSTKEISEQLDMPRKTVQNQLRSISLGILSRISPLLILIWAIHL